MTLTPWGCRGWDLRLAPPTQPELVHERVPVQSRLACSTVSLAASVWSLKAHEAAILTTFFFILFITRCPSISGNATVGAILFTLPRAQSRSWLWRQFYQNYPAFHIFTRFCAVPKRQVSFRAHASSNPGRSVVDKRSVQCALCRRTRHSVSCAGALGTV